MHNVRETIKSVRYHMYSVSRWWFCTLIKGWLLSIHKEAYIDHATAVHVPEFNLLHAVAERALFTASRPSQHRAAWFVSSIELCLCLRKLWSNYWHLSSMEIIPCLHISLCGANISVWMLCHLKRYLMKHFEICIPFYTLSLHETEFVPGFRLIPHENIGAILFLSEKKIFNLA